MGSGSRFEFGRSNSLGAGFGVSRFPFALTIHAHILLWYVQIGFGPGYDEPQRAGFWARVWTR